MTDKPAAQLAKSLHTVSVLVNLVQHFVAADDQPVSDAMERALNCLGLADKVDTYGLVQTALRQLEKKGAR